MNNMGKQINTSHFLINSIEKKMNIHSTFKKKAQN